MRTISFLCFFTFCCFAYLSYKAWRTPPVAGIYIGGKNSNLIIKDNKAEGYERGILVEGENKELAITGNELKQGGSTKLWYERPPWVYVMTIGTGLVTAYLVTKLKLK